MEGRQRLQPPVTIATNATNAKAMANPISAGLVRISLHRVFRGSYPPSCICEADMLDSDSFLTNHHQSLVAGDDNRFLHPKQLRSYESQQGMSHSLARPRRGCGTRARLSRRSPQCEGEWPTCVGAARAPLDSFTPFGGTPVRFSASLPTSFCQPLQIKVFEQHWENIEHSLTVLHHGKACPFDVIDGNTLPS